MTQLADSAAESHIVVSIVSHGHGKMVAALLADLARCAEPGLSVVLTLNIAEAMPELPAGLPVSVISNENPRGFGANHNAAFQASAGRFFCVLNPDARIEQNLFPRLVSLLDDAGVGVVAPLAVNSAGIPDNNARRFPTLPIVAKLVFRKLIGHSSARDYSAKPALIEPDWVAGLFMLFRHDTFEQLGGFDEGYFLYWEDIDLCARLRLQGKRVLVDSSVRIVHDAQRASHRNLRHAGWHAGSVVRWFLGTGVYRKLASRRLL